MRSHRLHLLFQPGDIGRILKTAIEDAQAQGRIGAFVRFVRGPSDLPNYSCGLGRGGWEPCESKDSRHSDIGVLVKRKTSELLDSVQRRLISALGPEGRNFRTKAVE